jgi:hypothetical protein
MHSHTLAHDPGRYFPSKAEIDDAFVTQLGSSDPESTQKRFLKIAGDRVVVLAPAGESFANLQEYSRAMMVAPKRDGEYVHFLREAGGGSFLCIVLRFKSIEQVSCLLVPEEHRCLLNTVSFSGHRRLHAPHDAA